MRALVIGDAMRDTYYVGRFGRINPERSSTPLLSVVSKKTYPGGAANVASNLKALGVQVYELYGAGSILKTRLCDEQGVVYRFDEDNDLEPVNPSLLPSVDFDFVVVSDYAKGSVTPELAPQLQERYTCPIYVDTKASPSPWTPFARCLFPNTREYKERKFEYSGSKMVMVKRGADGATLMRLGSHVIGTVAVPRGVTAVSTCGAGDTVLAAFAYAEAKLKPATDAFVLACARFSMAMAAVSVSSAFTCSPTTKDMVNLFPDKQEEFWNVISENY